MQLPYCRILHSWCMIIKIKGVFFIIIRFLSIHDFLQVPFFFFGWVLIHHKMPFNTSLFFSFFYSSSHQSWESFVLFWYLLSWKSLKEAMQRGEVIYVIHHICKISKNWLRRKLFTRFSSFVMEQKSILLS